MKATVTQSHRKFKVAYRGELNMNEAEPIEDSQDVGQHYRFEHLALRIVLKDLYFSKDAPGPGDQVPDFDLPTLGGGHFRSTDLSETGPALLIFGSYTCNVTDRAAPGLRELHARFGDSIRFVLVNVREAHPGKSTPQPKTMEEKMKHAEQMRDFHRFKFDVAVDDIDGSFHRAMSPKVNSAYVLGKDGVILFRAHWANDTKGLTAALESIAAGESLSPSKIGGVVIALLRTWRHIGPSLDKGGDGAWADFWRIAPPVTAMAFALKLLGVGPPKD